MDDVLLCSIDKGAEMSRMLWVDIEKERKQTKQGEGDLYHQRRTGVNVRMICERTIRDRNISESISAVAAATSRPNDFDGE